MSISGVPNVFSRIDETLANNPKKTLAAGLVLVGGGATTLVLAGKGVIVLAAALGGPWTLLALGIAAIAAGIFLLCRNLAHAEAREREEFKQAAVGYLDEPFEGTYSPRFNEVM